MASQPSPFSLVTNPAVLDQQIETILDQFERLRLGDNVENTGGAEAQSNPREGSAPASRSPVILLVEDDAADARLIIRAMEKVRVPARVVHVKNGDDAVAYLAGERPYEDRRKNPEPYLVLMDAKLPRRWGLEVLHWMREQKSGVERVPVVMLTSSQHAVDIRQAYDYGVNSYLVKPQTSEQMLRMVALLKEYWFSLNQGPPQGKD
jgi:CheY-like chemotaxis protein